MAAPSMRHQVSSYIRTLQDQIVTAFEQLDPTAPPFKRDEWLRPDGGGGGQSCVFSCSPTVDAVDTILEKGGVNISIINGMLPRAAIQQMRSDHTTIPLDPIPPEGLPFFSAGLSLVIHPRNPHAPTTHCNYRYFEILTDPNDLNSVISWWFGGGADLTPYILYEEDAVHFHSVHKEACGPHLYAAMKKLCDEYFYLPHRQEYRGVGGIFYDDLSDFHHKYIPQPRPTTPADIFAMMQKLGNAFVPAYIPILKKRHAIPFTPQQKRWQLVRRGRYVEFNLIIDRGTKFGLMAPHARIESILMTLPETVRWEYQCELGEDPESEEGKLMAVVKKPREWV